MLTQTNGHALDVGLQVGSSTSTFVAPSGAVEQFTANGSGGWISPKKLDATLVTGTSNSTLTYNASGEKLTFNGSGWLTSDVDSNGLGNAYTYNAAGQVTKITETTGRFLAIAWSSSDASGYVTSVTDSGNRTTTYAHNAAGQLTRVDSPGGYWETYAYNTAGLVSEIQGVGPTSSTTVLIDLAYDSAGRVLSISQGAVGASGYARTTSYSGWGTSTLSMVDGNGHTTTHGIDASGLPTSTTDPLGRTTSWTYNANGDVTSVTAPGNTSATVLTYDSNNAPTSTSAPTGAESTATYGSAPGCSGSGGTAFDPHCTTDPSGDQTAYQYDSRGNLLTTTDTTPAGTGITSSAQTVATASGGCYTTTNSDGSTAVHGLAGEVCSSTNGNGNVTTYQYDTSGNRTAIVPPAPLGKTAFSYDSLGRVTSMTDGNGRTTTYAYNVRDQLVSTTYSSGTVLTQTWTPNGLEASSSQSSSESDTYTYDVLGQVTQRVSNHAGRTVTETSSYDLGGNLASYTDSNGTVTYVYDAANQLTQLIEPSGTCSTGTGSDPHSGCIKFSYNPRGLETKRVLPGNVTVVTTRDASDRPTRITATAGTGIVEFDKGYSYATSGDTMDVQTTTAYDETGIPDGAVTTYGYDSLDRLTSAVETSAGAVNASWQYSYDKDGNRTQQIRSGHTGATALTINYTYNAADQLVKSSADPTGSTWAYDANGNETRNGITGQTYSYSDQQGTTAIGASTYTPFGSGNTLTTSRTTSTGTTSYLANAAGLADDQTGSTGKAYDRRPDGGIVGARLTDGSRYYYALDALGSVVALFDKDGNYSGGYTYDPYGRSRNTDTSTAVQDNPIRYIGGYYDTTTSTSSNSCVYLLGARYYDPTIGRFTQQDPSGQEANAYAYGSANPINRSDPNGTLSHRQKVLLLLGLLMAFVSAVICLSLSVIGCAILAGFAAVFVDVIGNAMADRDRGYSYTSTWKRAVTRFKHDGVYDFLGGALTAMLGRAVAHFAG